MKFPDLDYQFEEKGVDEWKQKWLACPICGHARKQDGLVLHMMGQAKQNPKYKKWLKEHTRTEKKRTYAKK
jgi:hypothetical protein